MVLIGLSALGDHPHPRLRQCGILPPRVPRLVQVEQWLRSRNVTAQLVRWPVNTMLPPDVVCRLVVVGVAMIEGGAQCHLDARRNLVETGLRTTKPTE